MQKALVVVAVLVALVAGGVYLAYNYLDLIVKLAFEHYGPDITGVTVKVGDVHISPRDGRGVIRNLEIGTPKGFAAPRAAKVGEIRVVLDPRTVTDPVVLIRELIVEAPSITYERTGSSTNLDAINKSIEAYVKRAGGSDPAKAGEKQSESRRRFIVERLVIRGAKVTMTNPGLRGQGITFDLPDIQLANLGKRTGLTASEIAQVVTSTLIARIAQKVLSSVDLIRRGGVEGAVDALKGLLK